MLDSFIHATHGAPVNGYDGDKCKLTYTEAKTGGILRYALMSHFNDYALKSMDATTTSADCQLDDDMCRSAQPMHVDSTVSVLRNQCG